VCTVGYSGSGTAVCGTEGEWFTIDYNKNVSVAHDNSEHDVCIGDTVTVQNVGDNAGLHNIQEVDSDTCATSSYLNEIGGDVTYPATPPPTFSGAELSADDGSTRYFICSAHCSGNKKFSAKCTRSIECTPNSCTSEQVDHSDHSTDDSINGTTGQTVAVTCNAGYVGGGAFTCGTDGTFSGASCNANSCTHWWGGLANSNKENSGVGGHTGEVVSLTCNAGYDGGGAFTCETNGTFSFSGQPCTASACTDTNVAHSDYSSPDSINGTTGDTVAVTCDVGYVGGGDFTCGTDGSFSGTLCTPAPSCASTQVAHSDHSTTNSINGTTGETVAVGCTAGYVGGGAFTCQADGQFSGTPCTIGHCQSTQVSHSDYSAALTITGTLDDIITVTCNVGYDGGGDFTCMPNLHFSGTPCTDPNATIVCIHPDVTVHVLDGVSVKSTTVESLDVGDLVIGEGRTSTVKRVEHFKVDDMACVVPKNMCGGTSENVIVSKTHAVRCPSWPVNTWTFCQPEWSRVPTTKYVHVELESYFDDHIMSGSVILESWDGYARSEDTINDACSEQGCPWPHKWKALQNGDGQWSRVDLRNVLFDSTPRLRIERGKP